MKIKDLRDLLAGFPDDAELLIGLNPNCGSNMLEKIEIGNQYGGRHYTVRDNQFAYAPENAVKVFIGESAGANNNEPFDEQIRLGLPEEFLDLCAQNNVDPERVLHGFIADLCELTPTGQRNDRLYSHGDNERRLAGQYFELLISH